MSKSQEVLKIIAVHHQKTLPAMLPQIDTCHASNIKDRLRELHKVIAALVAHTLLKEAEASDPELRAVANGAITPDVARTLASQGVNVSSNMNGPRQTKTVIVGTELPLPGEANLPMGGAPQFDQDPEPGNRIQIFTRRNGTTVVIPPLGSKAPKKVFESGENVDATYIAAYDQPEA
jgi:hypothetical protein